jgi:PilZ domain
MKSNALDLTINPKKAHALLDRRYAERAPAHYRITYAGEEDFDECTGEGTVRDLSKTGCQIISLNPPALGSRITLTLYLPDGNLLSVWSARPSVEWQAMCLVPSSPP